MINRKQSLAIKVKNNFVAFHRWETAPEEVSFLRTFHRHIFYVTTEISVIDEDRELEFFIVKNKIEKFLLANYQNRYFSYSCESICKNILGFLYTSFGKDRQYSIEVSEDNENSSILKTY